MRKAKERIDNRILGNHTKTPRQSHLVSKSNHTLGTLLNPS